MGRRSKRKQEPVQIIDGQWYAVAFGGEPFTEECCDCALVHRVRYKVENGKLWVQYTRLAKETRQRRKARGIVAWPFTAEETARE